MSASLINPLTTFSGHSVISVILKIYLHVSRNNWQEAHELPTFSQIHEKLFLLAKPYLDRNDFGASHTQRVLSIAQTEFTIPPEIADLTFASIILHDIGGSTIKDQYEKGPKIAETLLRQLGYANDFINKVCEIIRTHHNRPDSPSEPFKILYDSDQLVRFSKEEFPYYESTHQTNWDAIIQKMYSVKLKEKARKTLQERKTS